VLQLKKAALDEQSEVAGVDLFWPKQTFVYRTNKKQEQAKAIKIVRKGG
jgi:hypothetical protein